MTGMRQSQLFTKTRREAPADEVSKNAILLTRAGFINKEMAGVYSYLPLGLRVIRKIENIIREEMNAVGGQEILMPALQVKERYEATDRWNDGEVDIWFKTKLSNDTELGLGFSHEENLSPIMKNFLSSYRDLPVAVYQIQNKFRNELRSKSGIMRGREFLMKDMYSYALTQTQHDEYYERVKKAYFRLFERFGLAEQTFITFASGGSFSKFSHEFQTISDAGEDIIYLDRNKKLAVNKEVLSPEILEELGLKRNKLEEVKAIEVGNIFSLGTKFSEPFDLKVKDERGGNVTPIMGCYGIGLGRVMGTVVEVLSDENGMIWPKEIAPFRVHLIALGADQSIKDLADEVYATLKSQNIEVLYDNRDLRAGEKFADADLIGISTRVIVGEKAAESKMLEVKERNSDEIRMLTIEHLIDELTR